jgi:hypothetical protein
MTTAIKDNSSSTKLLAKDTKPLEKYLLPDGRIVEICASVVALKETGRLAVMRGAEGRVQAYLLDEKGDRQENEKGEPFFVKHGLDPNLEIEPVTRRGPKRRTDNMWWRGWGRKNAEKMDSLIKIVGEEGLWVKWPESRKNNYANIGFESAKQCSLFFSGEIGFNEKIEGALSYYPAFEKEGYVYKGKPMNAYMRFRLDLSVIAKNKKWSEFETMFRRQLKEWKRSYIAKARDLL